MKRRSIFVAAVITAALVTPSLNAASSDCDRTCLTNALDQYLTAMLKHDPKAAPLASSFRYTENAEILKAGEGIWKTASGLGKIQRRYADPVTGQALYFGHLENNGTPGIASLRIRVENRTITEAELVVGGKVDVAFDAEGLTAVPPPDGPVAPAARSSREQLLAAARSYFDGLQNHDGSAVLSHPGCVRIENGVKLTGRPIPNAAPGKPTVSDCSNNLDVFQSTISEVVHRRYPVIDEDAGVAFGAVVFNRPPGAKRQDGSLYPRNLLTEIFVLESGRIRSIYAAMHYMTPDNPAAPNWP